MSLKTGSRLKANSKARLVSQEIFGSDLARTPDTEIDIRRTAKMERRIQ
jgi:hypothetical protein